MIKDLMRDPAKTMPEDPHASEVKALRVWHCKYQSLAGLTDYTDLETLVVASYPDGDLDPLVGLRRLRYLRLLHLPGVRDLAALSALTELRTVRLETLPSWDSSGKVTQLESLQPLANLPNLAHLELFGVRPEDRSLRDLEAAPSLLSVRVSKYPKAETARFYESTGLSDAYAPAPPVPDWQ